ncbi:dihydroorotate dehydrogenase [bacterium MnTg02]|nr:dihydroorotate dehydrogenase [bacterium MnTg02]
MMSQLFRLARPLLNSLGPETAHELTLRLLEKGVYRRQRRPDDPRLHQEFWNLRFRNPIGIAAGFDKDGRVPDALIKLGFGFVEVGTVTPAPQLGNPKPRVFRLAEEHAVVNRLGFNSQGRTAVHKRLEQRSRTGVLGVNIGANKDSPNRTEDYVEGVGAFADVADYFTVNISSPNTPGLRELQDPEHLNALLSWLFAARGALMEAGEHWRPILVKLSPDIGDQDLPSVINCLTANDIDGIVIANTTIAREGLPDSKYKHETGGLSGRPLFNKSTRMLARVYRMTEGKIPLIGVGGIDSGETALTKIEAGASLLQIYTGLIYEGPDLLKRIKRKLIAHMDALGYNDISEVVGQKAEQWAEHGGE